MPEAIITQVTPFTKAQNFVTESEITITGIVNDYNYNLNFSEGDVITSGATLYLNEFKEPETINGVVQTPKVIITYV
jgi:hypothetical protein